MPHSSSLTVPHSCRVEAHVSVFLSGPHFSEYLYFTVSEDCTVMLACKVTSGGTGPSPALRLPDRKRSLFPRWRM